VYVRLSLLDAIVMSALLFILSLGIAFVLTLPLQKSIESMLKGITQWQTNEEAPIIHTSFIKKLNNALHGVLDEVKKSLQEIAAVGDNIKASTDDFSVTSEQINASLEEVSSTVQNISRGAHDQSTSIMAIVQSIEDLYDLTTSISSQVDHATASSRTTTDSAKMGMDFSKKETTMTKEIFTQTKFIEDKMRELREQSNEIRKILDIIGGIAEQTDLLALNAAIEAARVGKQGRGFAVVADEIRNLATETQHSSAIVEDLILDINKTIQELNNLLASEREKINASSQLATQTEQQFTDIVKAVDSVTAMITRIHDAATKQSARTKDIVNQVDQMAQVATDTAAATEEVSAAIEEQTASMQQFTETMQVLASIASKLHDLLSRFKQ
jgi:methyl-accepting chemotaxis protein